MIPNAPTDNLYKFMTFIGLAMVLFYFWSVNDYFKQMEVRFEEIEATDAKFDKAKSNIITEMKDLGEKLRGQADRANTPNPLDAQIVEIEARETRAAITKLSENYASLNRETDAMIEKTRRMIKRSNDDLLMPNIAFALGTLFAIWGCSSWYFLHQRYQDMLLKAQVITAVRLNEDVPTTSTISSGDWPWKH